MVAGLLLARAGVAVTVLEKHKDFLRDFRGDTVHPSTLELFHEIGLLDDLLKLPHARFDTATLDLFGHRYTVATLRHLPVAAPYIAMMPQWDLLDFIARTAPRDRKVVEVGKNGTVGVNSGGRLLIKKKHQQK